MLRDAYVEVTAQHVTLPAADFIREGMKKRVE